MSDEESTCSTATMDSMHSGEDDDPEEGDDDRHDDNDDDDDDDENENDPLILSPPKDRTAFIDLETAGN